MQPFPAEPVETTYAITVDPNDKVAERWYAQADEADIDRVGRVHVGEHIDRVRFVGHGGRSVHAVPPILPHMSNTGAGAHGRTAHLHQWIADLSARLRRVRVACGDFRRVLTPSALCATVAPLGILLDPPYAVGSHLYRSPHLCRWNLQGSGSGANRSSSPKVRRHRRPRGCPRRMGAHPRADDLSFETAPDVFQNGRILLSLLPETAPPEVVAQIGGADLVSAAALVEWSEVA